MLTPFGSPYPATESQIRWVVSHHNDVIFRIDFFFEIDGERYQFGVALVNEKTGQAELYLDNRPYMFTGAMVRIKGKVWKFEPQEFSITSVVITILEREFFSCFKKPIANLGGFLKDSNLSYFRKVYQDSSHLPAEERIRFAYDQTSFGKNRNKLGITDVEIKVLARDAEEIPTQVLVSKAKRPNLDVSN
jgi:hypothetical protein